MSVFRMLLQRAAALFLSFCVLLPLAGAARADDANIAAALEAMLRREWDAYAAGRPQWAGGMGVQVLTPGGGHYAAVDLEYKRNDIRFRGAGLTTTYTAAAVLLLHQRGLLDLDDHIVANMPGRDEPYVPGTPDYALPYKELITIRQLLGNVAGVFDVINDTLPPDIEAPYAGGNYVLWKQAQDFTHTFSPAELLNVAAAHGLAYFAPEVGFRYSNAGYALLGAIIERVSGKTCAQFVREELLVPNGLQQTSFPDQGESTSLPPPAPASTFLLDEGQLREVTAANPSPHVAAGNVLTTPADLASWLYKLFRAEAGVNRKLIIQMTDVEQFGADYGLGCRFSRELGYGQVGAFGGFMTVAGYLPAAQAAVVVFCNAVNAGDLDGQLEMLTNVGAKAQEIVASFMPSTPAWEQKNVLP